MTLQRLTERVSPTPFSGTPTADTDGVIRGVVICGLRSANGRVYPPDVLRKAVKKYEGVQVYLDHNHGRGERGVREWFGELRNVRSRADGRPEGDLHFDPNHQFAAEFRSRAERFPRSLGLSHVAYASVVRRDGREVVEAIDRIESVDLVASPATNQTLLESKRTGAMPTTLRAVIESVLPRLTPERRAFGYRFLAEQDEGAGMAMMDAPVDMPEPAPEGDPDDALWTGFSAAIQQILDQYAESKDAAAAIKEIGRYLKAHAKLTSGGGESESESESEPASEPEGGEETPAKESRIVNNVKVIREAIEVCRAVGFKGFDADDLEAIAALPAARRESLARKLMGAAKTSSGEERPESGGRHRTAKLDAPVVESTQKAEPAAAGPFKWID